MKIRHWPTTDAHVASNVHPNYRSLWLSHIRQLRKMIRDGRQDLSARNALKAAQKNMLAERRALAAA